MIENKPVILIHAYAHDSDAEERLSPLDRLALIAAGELMSRGSAQRIVLTSGSLQEGQPPIAELGEVQLRQLFPDIDPELITVSAKGRSTVGEVREFAKLAEENNWPTATLVQLGLLPHLPRMKKVKQNIFDQDSLGVRIMSAERYLNMVDPGKYNSVIREVRKTPLYRGMEKAEIIKNTIYSIPVVGRQMIMSGETHANKGKIQDTVLKFLGQS